MGRGNLAILAANFRIEFKIWSSSNGVNPNAICDTIKMHEIIN